VIPLSKGGSDELENVKPSHGYCNIKKSGMRTPAISKYLPPSKIKI
jgi:5-methylcytosine-specific restriction endonuclease McrA